MQPRGRYAEAYRVAEQRPKHLAALEAVVVQVARAVGDPQRSIAHLRSVRKPRILAHISAPQDVLRDGDTREVQDRAEHLGDLYTESGQNFTRLALGCLEANICKKILL